MTDYGSPDHYVEQLFLSWGEDWMLEYANEYDVAEDFVHDLGAKGLNSLLRGIDALLGLPDEQARRAAVYSRQPFTGEGELDEFLGLARQRVLRGLEHEEPEELLPPPGWKVPVGEEREGPFPELLNLARYVEGYTEGRIRSIFLDQGDREVDAGWATVHRLRERETLYCRRLLKEVNRLRAEEPTKQGRLAALGGVELWDAEQDPAEFLDFVEHLCTTKLERGFIPSDLGLSR